MTDTRIVKAEEQPQPQQPMALVAIDPRVIAVAKQNAAIMEQVVTEVLEPDIDYGILEGTDDNTLFDPGASTIMDVYNVYPHHITQRETDSQGRITVTSTVELIHRQTHQVVAEGMGAASGLETKYAYRWLTESEAARAGYSKDALAHLPKQQRKGRYGTFTRYRTGNPDPGELLHVLTSMSNKRGEIDAVKQLPGVKKALAKIGISSDTGPTYRQFWSEAKRLGFTEEQARAIFGVKSMKDWEAGGHSLDEAIARLREARQRGPEHPPAVRRVSVPERANPVSTVNTPASPVPTINTPEELVTWVKSVNHKPDEIRPALGLGPKALLTDTPQNMAYQLAEVWGLTVSDEALSGQEEDPF